MILFSEIAKFAMEYQSAKIENFIHDFELQGLATEQSWRANRLAFSNEVNVEMLKRSHEIKNAALVLHRDADNVGCPSIRVDNPRLVFAKIVEEFFVPKPIPSIDPTAVVAPDCEIDPTASIGPYCVIGPHCKIGAGTILHKHVVLSKNITIGKNCVLWSHCVIGEDSYGIERSPGALQTRMPHLGGVLIGDGVHIGNFTSVVAGTIEPTRIDDGTMIDNLVHVAHNVQIGKNCQVIACAEISGSVILRENVTIAPNATVIQKVEIGENSLVGLGAVVVKSVPANVIVTGVPAKIIREISPPEDK